jgi:DNA-binding LacI/PurR family transcriptional regulator
MMASIIDVAKKAGVSIATVSRVVNNSGYVNQATREKVIESIKALGYVPNELARSMLKKKTKLIAMIVPGLYNPFFADIAHHVEQELDQHGFKMLITNSSSPLGLEVEYLEMLKQNKVDGLIIISDNEIEDLIESELPIVSFDRHFEHTPYVSCDNYEGGKLAAKTLADASSKHLLYLGDDSYVSQGHFATEVSKRKSGFLTYCRENNLDCDVLEFPKNTPIEDTIQTIIKEKKHDGIFAISDFLATKIIKEANRQHVNIPKDIKVIGFDGMDDALNTGLIITSIYQDRKKIAKELVDTLIKKIKGKHVSHKIIPISLKDGETV